MGPDSLLGRDGISRVCQILATLHLRKSKGSGNEFDDLQRLFMVLTKASVGAADNTAGPAFFDSVLEPYAKVRTAWCCGLCIWRCDCLESQGLCG